MEKDDEKFFYEDVVSMVSPKSGLVKYGLVVSTHKSRTENNLKKSGSKNSKAIKVIWHPNGIEEIVSEDKVVLIDRSLMPGDVVRKVKEGKPSQFGYCANIDIFTTVKILNTNKIIENVSSRNLSHTKPFAIDSSVFYESWVGGVYDVKFKVTFASKDGSVFTLEDPFRQDFISLTTSDSFSIDENAFYHGQKLKMNLDSLENAKFITISNLMSVLWQNYKKKYNCKLGSKYVKVYVQDVTITSVEVEWYCQTSSKTKPREDNWPERLITGENLKKLKTIDLFESCSIQVGDTHWYNIKNTDNLITMKQWLTKSTETFLAGPNSLHNRTKNEQLHKHPGSMNSSKNIISSELGNSNDLVWKHNGLNNSNLEIVQETVRFNKKESKYKIQCIKTESSPNTSIIGRNSIHKLKSNRLKRNRMWKSLVKKNKQFNVPKVSTKPNSKVVVEICYTKSVVDVIWQDGDIETGVPSTDLYPVQTLDDLEFFPGDFVTVKNPPPDVYGVIESVDHAERFARVQWFKLYPENPSLPNPIEKTDFSVYDLRDHPDFHFKSGCLIIHISPDTNPDSNTLTAGQVLSVGPHGKICVMWVNGEKTLCWPQELFVVKLHDDDISFQDDEFDGDDDAPLAVVDDLSEDWVSVSSPGSSNKSNEHGTNEKFPKIAPLLKAVAGIQSFLDAIERNNDADKFIKFKKTLEQIRLSLNSDALFSSSETSHHDLLDNGKKLIDKVISTIDNLYTEIGDDMLCDNSREDKVDRLKKTASDFIDKVHSFCKNLTSYSMSNLVPKFNKNDDLLIDRSDVALENFKPTSLLPIIELPNECHNISMGTDIEPECEVIAKPEEAGVFNMVETLLANSHKYINDKDDINPTMLKFITKDIQILQKSLPAGIWVKTFENRMDLFSIMIRGPEKTPYAGGLFLFDVKLPSFYPQHPPFCHYYSFCDDRLNPNLYEDGKVCLSLLGTWTGHGVELWSPKDSNLLQLLVSIQGLILVSEPYYNEAGFDSQRGQKLAKENSRVYNEMALIKVVQSMTNMLSTNYAVKNASYFKDEILEHVKFHGPKLINTIENWIKMSEKELTEDEKLATGFPLLPLSKGFCLSIKKALNDYREVLISMNIMFK